jgi:hypothetical protein
MFVIEVVVVVGGGGGGVVNHSKENSSVLNLNRPDDVYITFTSFTLI